MTTLNITGLIRKNQNKPKGLLGKKITILFRRCLVLPLILVSLHSSLKAQDRVTPTWWFGVAGAANFNFYRGTAQILNDNLTLPYAFENGFGVAPYAAVFTEYRPGKVWGLMLYFGYDGREGMFNRIEGPTPASDGPGTLNAMFSYLTLEPSLRIAPFSGKFYLFIGPRFSYNVTNDFVYEAPSTPNNESKWSDVYGVRVSAQIGAGYDIPLSAPANTTQVELSPFIAFLPYFGEQPRSLENLTLTTVRAGLALKFGCGPKPAQVTVIPAPVPDANVQFSVQSPGTVPNGNHIVKETLPLCDYVFFDAGNTQIPTRYVLLTKDQATSFTEEQLQDCQKTQGTRSTRQLMVYHNLINILADRMKRHPSATIKLVGASAGKGKEIGKANADAVKYYLVNTFGINSGRIATEGRNQPLVGSEQANDTNDVILTSVEDNRVDIISTSPDLMMEVKDNSALCMKPIEVTAIDGSTQGDAKVSINTAGASEAFKSWTVDITDSAGNVQHYGPFISDNETISGSAILNGSNRGTYKILMTGQTATGGIIKKETSFSLNRAAEPTQPEQRASILFEFDKSVTVATFKSFLTNTVAPLVSPNSTVIISGHTDIVGEKEHNLNLSKDRAMEAQNILSDALSKTGVTGVTYQTNGYGESNAAFSNTLPEERFYNRTVIIDIIPAEVSMNH
jgi:outer membrane protein OmpA-like peptidoglycan-associated protein